MAVGLPHADADRVPVHLRDVEAGAALPEEDRIRKRWVVVDVREAREREGIVAPDPGAEPSHVGARRGVPALVARLGVDHEAVGAVARGACSRHRLAPGMEAVHELPPADAQAAGVKRSDQRGRELLPLRAVVRRLHEHRMHVRGVRPAGDRRDGAAAGVADVPDPHPLAREGAVAGAGRGLTRPRSAPGGKRARAAEGSQRNAAEHGRAERPGRHRRRHREKTACKETLCALARRCQPGLLAGAPDPAQSDFRPSTTKRGERCAPGSS